MPRRALDASAPSRRSACASTRPPRSCLSPARAGPAIIEEIRAFASAPVAGAEAPRLARGQVLVAHIEHGPDGLAVAALETYGVTTKDPTAHARKASKKH